MINTDPIYQEQTIQRDRHNGHKTQNKDKKKKQPKHSTQKSKKMINTDPIYQEWTIQRDRQQWAQDVEQRQKKTTKTLNTEK